MAQIFHLKGMQKIALEFSNAYSIITADNNNVFNTK